MGLGYDRDLYILAFDHRGSFAKMFGISGREPTAEETAQIQDAKRLIFEGFQQALAQACRARPPVFSSTTSMDRAWRPRRRRSA